MSNGSINRFGRWRTPLIILAVCLGICFPLSAQHGISMEDIQDINIEEILRPSQTNDNKKSLEDESFATETNGRKSSDFSDTFLQRRREYEGTEIPVPDSLKIIGRGKGVELVWDEYPLQVAGFRVYRAGELVNKDSLITERYFKDTPPHFFHEYDYYVTVMLPMGFESFPSNAVTGSALNFAGRGTKDEPYIVKTAEQLSDIIHSPASHYRLEANIDLGVPPWNENGGWNPIGRAGRSFNGVFDGNGYKIINLTIDRPESNNQGLFSAIRSAEIKNFGLIDVNINGRNNVGAVTSGIIESTVRNSYVTGKIVGGNVVGGIAGYSLRSSGAIINCYNAASVHASGKLVGGLTGEARSANIIRSYSIGEIIFDASNDAPGALVGSITYSKVYDSFWDIIAVRLTDLNDDGIGLKTACMLDKETFEKWNFDEVWAIGDENNEKTYPWLRIQGKPYDFNCPGNLPPDEFYAYTRQNGNIILVWSPPDPGKPDSYIIFRNGQRLKRIPSSALIYTDDDAKHLNTYKYHLTAVYGEEQSRPSFPVIITSLENGYAGGKGTVEEPYRISLPSHLYNVRFNPEAHYIQMNDVDLSGYNNWEPIGSGQDLSNDDTISYPRYFTGYYNGDEFVISNLTVNVERGKPAGLFGTVGTQWRVATFKNIRLENANVSGAGNVGGLVGRVNRNSLIENCGVSGKISGTSENGSNVGGLLGYASEATVLRSYNRANVSAEGDNVGGLAGKFLQGSIKVSYSIGNVYGRNNVGSFMGFCGKEQIFDVMIINCFARSEVKGTGENIGGFIGYFKGGEVLKCYAVVDMSSLRKDESSTLEFFGRRERALIHYSYWKAEEVEEEPDWGVEKRTEEDMKYPIGRDIYFDWDFDDIWQIDPDGKVNDGFPFFRYWNKDVREVEIITNPYRRKPIGFVSNMMITDGDPFEQEDVAQSKDRAIMLIIGSLLYRNPLFITVVISIVGMLIVYLIFFKLSFYLGVIVLVVNASGLVYKLIEFDIASVIPLLMSLYIGLLIFYSRCRKKDLKKSLKPKKEEGSTQIGTKIDNEP